MSDESQNNKTVYCSFVSIHYIICECGETFPNEDTLKSHLDTEHPHKTEKKEFTCGLCDEAFVTEEECLHHHQKNHTVRIIKPPSPPPVKYIIQPIKTENDTDSYEVFGTETPCTNNIKEEFDVNNYEVFHTESPCTNNIKKEYVVDKCMIVTSGKHPGTKKKKRYAKINIKNKICEVCGKKYASNAALIYHQRVHTGERPYKCNYCDKAFTMPLFLQIHHRIHTGEKPYQCPHCPKAFGNKAALLRHDRVHTGVKPYTCPHCFRSFTQSNSMKLHVHTVHLKLPAPYKSRRRKEKIARRPPPSAEFGKGRKGPEVYALPKDVNTAMPNGPDITTKLRGANRIELLSGAEIKVYSAPNKIARGPDKIELIKSPEKIELPRGPDTFALPRGPDTFALPRGPDTFALPRGPDTLALPRSPERIELPKNSEIIALPKGPERFSILSGLLNPDRIELPRILKRTALPKGHGGIALPRSPEAEIVELPRSSEKIALPRSPETVELPRSPDRILLPKSSDMENPARSPCNEEKRWTVTQQVIDELPDICVVKTEEVFPEGQSVFYDHDTGQEVLYEVVYQQE